MLWLFPEIFKEACMLTSSLGLVSDLWRNLYQSVFGNREEFDCLTDCWRGENCESRHVFWTQNCSAPLLSENSSSPTSSVPTVSINCTLCYNLKGRISVEVIILVLWGFILDLPRSHLLAIRCSCWRIVMQIWKISNKNLKKALH